MSWVYSIKDILEMFFWNNLCWLVCGTLYELHNLGKSLVWREKILGMDSIVADSRVKTVLKQLGVVIEQWEEFYYVSFILNLFQGSQIYIQGIGQHNLKCPTFRSQESFQCDEDTVPEWQSVNNIVVTFMARLIKNVSGVWCGQVQQETNL